MSRGFYWNGRQYLTPVVVSAIDESAMADTAVALSDNLAILGTSNYGVPGVVHWLSSADDAVKMGIDGDSLAAIKKAFDPSAETGGPAKIGFLRVGSPTQSSATLTDGASSPAITLLTSDYGIRTVGAQIKVEAGTAKGRKITVKQNGVSEVGDNLYLAPMTVFYTGNGSTPRAQVNTGDITLRLSGSVVAMLPFAQYPTVQQLVDAINVVQGFSATAAPGLESLATAALFDTSTNQDIGAGLDITAINVAVTNWINSSAEPTVFNATQVFGAGAVAVTSGFVVAQGGTSPTVVNQDWSNAFDLLQTEDVQWVVPVSGAASIHAMASAHVDYMSTVARAERRAWCGTALGTSDAAALAEALSLNDDRVSLVHLGVWDYDASGTLTLFAPYILAAQCAGAMAGLPPGTALTNKTLKCQGFERQLKNPTDTDALIAGGVVPFDKTSRGYRCTRSITTWLANDNFNRVEVSTGTALDYVVRALRETCETEVGKNGSALLLAEIISRCETVLDQLATPNPIGPGVIVGDATSPAWKGLTASLTGDHIVVQVQVSPVIPTNFIGILVHAVPYSGTASA
jgi:hypothetical protein